ncbi:MAG: M50 family metallopeptidase [Clostridia bacterium]|nr:M50 family metallopeptidase [Clostridia bacterium]
MSEKREKKKFNLRNYVGMLFFLAIGGFSGWFIGYYLGETAADGGLGQTLWSFAVLLLGMYVMLYAQIVIHEAGHLVFGLLTGYRFSLFRIFSLTFLRDPDSGKIKVRRMQLAGTGGQCLLVPPEPVDGKIPFALYHLGGVLMNLIASAVFFVLYLLTRSIPMLSLFFLIGVIVGIAYAMMNGIPMRLGAVDNDGYNLYAQTRSPHAVEAMRIQLLTAEAIARGKRLRDLPAEWFTVPEEASLENSMVAVIAVFACNRLMDEGRYEEAEEAIRTLCAKQTGMVGVHRSLLLCDRITCLLLNGKTAEADALLTKELTGFMKAMKTNPSVVRTQYAIARLQKHDAAEAEVLLGRFEACAKSHPFPSDIVSERQVLTAIDAAASDTQQ